MQILLKIVAVAASIVPFLAAVGLGTAASVVPESGERISGLVLTIGALVAFAATMLLVFAPVGFFRGNRRVLAVLSTAAGAMPLAAVAWISFVFADSPFSGNASVLDWGGVGLGILLVVGLLAIVLIGYRRHQEAATPASARSPTRAPDRIRGTSEPLPSYEAEDDVRVTRI